MLLCEPKDRPKRVVPSSKCNFAKAVGRLASSPLWVFNVFVVDVKCLAATVDDDAVTVDVALRRDNNAFCCCSRKIGRSNVVVVAMIVRLPCLVEQQPQ